MTPLDHDWIGTYILEGKKAIPVDTLTWAKWFQNNPRHVNDELVGDIRISTVFLGLDHGWRSDRPPLLFETMIFGGPHNEEMQRCSTWEEAEVIHKATVERIREEQAWLDKTMNQITGSCPPA